MNDFSIHALRLFPNQDLKQYLSNYTYEKHLTAGFILTCVGSLIAAKLRLPNAREPTHFHGEMKIVSLVGTLSLDGLHLNISLADKEGLTFGGYLMDGCLIHTTAEIVIGQANQFHFARELDPNTGEKELLINKKC